MGMILFTGNLLTPAAEFLDHPGIVVDAPIAPMAYVVEYRMTHDLDGSKYCLTGVYRTLEAALTSTTTLHGGQVVEVMRVLRSDPPQFYWYDAATIALVQGNVDTEDWLEGSVTFRIREAPLT